MVMIDEHATGEVPIMVTSSALIGGSTECRTGDSVAEATTGPQPILDLLDGHMHLARSREHVIVALDGGLDDALAATLAPAVGEVARAAAAVVIDLDDVALLDRDALESVLAALGDADETPRCLVAGRISGRMVLDRWGIMARFAVFGSVADALQARAFAASGYGSGWAPQV